MISDTTTTAKSAHLDAGATQLIEVISGCAITDAITAVVSSGAKEIWAYGGIKTINVSTTLNHQLYGNGLFVFEIIKSHIQPLNQMAFSFAERCRIPYET